MGYQIQLPVTQVPLEAAIKLSIFGKDFHRIYVVFFISHLFERLLPY